MLGCLLYEVCSLEKPFSGENISVLMSKILKEEPKPLPVVYSNFIQKLTRTLLTKNHQKRPEIEEILAFKELRIEIKSLIERFPNYYKPLEELYCKNQDISVPKTFEYKKKSLIKPLSYSNLPNVEITNGENIEKWYTPNNQKKNDDKNSILNVIKQAKKKRPDELDSPQVPYNNSNNIEQDPSDSAGLKGKVSFEQYLTKKLIVEKTEDNMVLVKKNEKIEEGDKKKNLIEKHNKKLKNLDIIEEKSPMNKFNLEEEEEEKKSNNNISINNVRIISPTNFNKLKRNSPKGNILEIEIVSSQRSKLFIEFLKERLGEEKFEKVKAILQTEENNSTGNIIDKKRNEILEVIGIKNAEVLKYLGVLCKDGLNKDKKVIMIEGLEGGIQETRIDRTCSGNAKLEGGSSRK